MLKIQLCITGINDIYKKYTLINAGLKNNPTLTTSMGHYRTEHALGWFNPSAVFFPFHPYYWVIDLTQPLGEIDHLAGLSLTLVLGYFLSHCLNKISNKYLLYYKCKIMSVSVIKQPNQRGHCLCDLNLI